MTDRSRTPIQKLLLALEHHGKGYKELAGRIALHAFASGWEAFSWKGGANSWELISPKGKHYSFRARNGNTIVVSRDGKVRRVLKTRLDVDRFFEKTT